MTQIMSKTKAGLFTAAIIAAVLAIGICIARAQIYYVTPDGQYLSAPQAQQQQQRQQDEPMDYNNAPMGAHAPMNGGEQSYCHDEAECEDE